MPQKKDGGNAKKVDANPALNATPKCSILAVPIIGQRKPEVYPARNMDDFVKKNRKKITVNLRKSDGSSKQETIDVKSYEDIELSSIVENSEVLKGQQIERNFLYNFLEEWKKNPAFRAQFMDLLNNPIRKGQMVSTLNEIRRAIKVEETPTPLFSFLNNIKA